MYTNVGKGDVGRFGFEFSFLPRVMKADLNPDK